MFFVFRGLNKDLKEIGSRALSFREQLKLRKIRDLEEKKEALAYLVYSKIHLKYLDLLHKSEKLPKKSLSAEMHLKIIPAKLKIFKADFKKENFYNLLSLIKKIEKEMSNEYN